MFAVRTRTGQPLNTLKNIERNVSFGKDNIKIFAVSDSN